MPLVHLTLVDNFKCKLLKNWSLCTTGAYSRLYFSDPNTAFYNDTLHWQTTRFGLGKIQTPVICQYPKTIQNCSLFPSATNYLYNIYNREQFSLVVHWCSLVIEIWLSQQGWPTKHSLVYLQNPQRIKKIVSPPRKVVIMTRSAWAVVLMKKRRKQKKLCDELHKETTVW